MSARPATRPKMLLNVYRLWVSETLPLAFDYSFTADSYDWGSQTSGFAAYIGDEDSQLAPPPEELNPY